MHTELGAYWTNAPLRASAKLEPFERMTRTRTSRGAMPKLAAVLLGALVGLLAAEAALRAFLFHPALATTDLGARLRDPDSFARQNSEDAYWTLRALLGMGASDLPPGPDPWVGWRGSNRIVAETYAHADEPRLAGRRPVVLFGDSYAACATPRLECFEGLLADSALDAELALWNYGVGGFGLDQVLLLLERVLAYWDSLELPKGVQRPLVVLSIFVDDDLDRCDLRFRDWPKPRFELAAGELELERFELQPNSDYLARHGSSVRSFLWRYVLYGSGLLPRRIVDRIGGQIAHRERMQRLAPKLLERAAKLLDERGLEHFVLLFPGLATLRDGAQNSWQRSALVDSMNANGLRFVDAGQDFDEDMLESGRVPQQYFGTQGAQLGHYTALGNQIAFRALLRGIQGEGDR